MVRCRLTADVQPLRHFLIRKAFGEKTQDLPLATREDAGLRWYGPAVRAPGPQERGAHVSVGGCSQAVQHGKSGAGF
jgi:hypothetical protein